MILSKAIKLRKLVTEATNIETQIRKYSYEAHNKGFDIMPFHVANGDRGVLWMVEELVAKFRSRISCVVSSAPFPWTNAFSLATKTAWLSNTTPPSMN